MAHLAYLDFGMSTNGIASTHAAHTELDAQDDARQSTPKRNLRGAVTFHFRFTLGLFHFISLVWIAYHGRVPAAGLHPFIALFQLT